MWSQKKICRSWFFYFLRAKKKVQYHQVRSGKDQYQIRQRSVLDKGKMNEKVIQNKKQNNTTLVVGRFCPKEKDYTSITEKDK